MKPRKSFFAAIAEVLHKLDHQRLLNIGASLLFVLSVLEQHARNCAAFEVLAGGFGLILL
jgi:hypothetical protein